MEGGRLGMVTLTKEEGDLEVRDFHTIDEATNIKCIEALGGEGYNLRAADE